MNVLEALRWDSLPKQKREIFEELIKAMVRDPDMSLYRLLRTAQLQTHGGSHFYNDGDMLYCLKKFNKVRQADYVNCLKVEYLEFVEKVKKENESIRNQDPKTSRKE